MWSGLLEPEPKETPELLAVRQPQVCPIRKVTYEGAAQQGSGGRILVPGSHAVVGLLPPVASCGHAADR